jgi:2-oxoacid:acceptor oxidoreductase gamma subunit (pyruvate/2-ketoisovalerate family)
MLEIRFHGRGGQGTVVGSSILGMAFFYEGNFVQFFPEFGVERRGAPVQAFLRVSDSKVKAHYNIYEPDHIVLFDSVLLNSVNVTQGLKSNGWILVNSKKKPDEFTFDKKYRVATIDADGISLANRLGTEASPIINAAMIGAFSRIINTLSFDSVIKAIKESVPAKVSENIASAETAYKKVLMG